MKDSTSLFADCHIGPALAIEDSGNGEALDPGLHRVDILVEEEIDHRRVVELELIGLGPKANRIAGILAHGELRKQPGQLPAAGVP